MTRHHRRKARRRPRIFRDRRGLPAKRMPVQRVARQFDLMMHWVRRNGICVITENGKPACVVLNPEGDEALMRLIYATATVAAARRRNIGGVFTLADEIFGTRARTDWWMTQEIPSLGAQRPVDALATAVGREEVLNILHRIQYGIFA